MPLKPDLPPGSTELFDRGRCHEFFRRPYDHGTEGRGRGCCGRPPTPQGFQLKGDVKIGGTPASLEYRKSRGEADAEVRIARHARRGGAQQSRLRSRRTDQRRDSDPICRPRCDRRPDREGRFAIEADLTRRRSTAFCPAGPSLPASRRARPSRLTTKPQSIRIEDLLIEGAGGGVKGSIEFDGAARCNRPISRLTASPTATAPASRSSARRRRAARRHARRSL